jgi:hypothetical protein
MIAKKDNLSIRILFTLTALFFAVVLSNCAQPEKGDELQQGAALLRNYALRSNPSLKGTRFKVDLSIEGALGDCMCIKVCDANGQNCTACTCTPANCGGCD